MKRPKRASSYERNMAHNSCIVYAKQMVLKVINYYCVYVTSGVI